MGAAVLMEWRDVDFDVGDTIVDTPDELCAPPCCVLPPDPAPVLELCLSIPGNVACSINYIVFIVCILVKKSS